MCTQLNSLKIHKQILIKLHGEISKLWYIQKLLPIQEILFKKKPKLPYATSCSGEDKPILAHYHIVV